MAFVSPREISLIRTYKAPLNVVWDAWSNPKQLQEWWGPRGFITTTESRDLKKGGVWKYTMKGPDGTIYPNIAKYLEVEQEKLLIYDQGATAKTPTLFRVKVLFSEIPDGCKMTMTMTFETAEKATAARAFIKEAAGDSTWDRLAEYLEKQSSGKDLFVINRSFATPLNNLFEMWIRSEEFSKWIPPTGFTMKFLRSDIRAGGTTFYYMTEGKSGKIFGRAHYLEITKPRKLIYTQQFCDEKEKIIRHPLSPTWPETMLTTVGFESEGRDQSRITLSWEPHGTCTKKELNTFVGAKAGMTAGWTGSFDKLEGLIKG